MRAARPSTGFFRWLRLNPRPVIGLSTTRTVEEEVFSALEYISEIPEVGKEFLQKRGVPLDRVDLTFTAMQAFVRQAKTFYQSAKTLHHRAAPLNYYYAFLNLAKALICIEGLDAVNGFVRHGLSHTLDQGDLKSQKLTIHGGVFPFLYKVLRKRELANGFQLDVSHLFQYVTDVSHECNAVGFGDCRTLKTQYRIQRNAQHCYATLSIRSFHCLEKSKAAYEHFCKNFELVQLNTNAGREIFQLFAEQQSEHKFAETVKEFPVQGENVPVGEVSKHCYSAIEPLFLSMPYYLEVGDFYLCLPLNDNIDIPFDEILAIYGLMYFLSSLVRYNPSFLEKRLHSKDAWLIESFVSSSPRTFLMHLSNLIVGEDRIYTPR